MKIFYKIKWWFFPKGEKSRKYFLPSTDSVTAMTANTGMPENVSEYSWTTYR